MERIEDVRDRFRSGSQPSDTDHLPGKTAACRPLTASGKRVHPGEAHARTARGGPEVDPLPRRDSSHAVEWWSMASIRESTGSE